MPLKQCTKDGRSGWSWGNGACFVGKDSKRRAIRQGLAIEGPKRFREIMKSEGKYSEYETEILIADSVGIKDEED